MSGGGGSSRGYSGETSGGGSSGGAASADDCASLRFEAQLASPKPTVVATIEVGDVLDIRADVLNGKEVVLVLKDGQIAGGLVGPDATRLRRCLDLGNRYEAAVASKSGGLVRVSVSHA